MHYKEKQSHIDYFFKSFSLTKIVIFQLIKDKSCLFFVRDVKKQNCLICPDKSLRGDVCFSEKLLFEFILWISSLSVCWICLCVFTSGRKTERTFSQNASGGGICHHEGFCDSNQSDETQRGSFISLRASCCFWSVKRVSSCLKVKRGRWRCLLWSFINAEGSVMSADGVGRVYEAH